MTKRLRPRVFVSSAEEQNAALDAAAAALEDAGVDIVRGPPDRAGELRSYSADDRARYFHDVDAAVFSNRDLCSREVLVDSPQLRGVCFPVIGIETLDLDAASELGIIVGHGALREIQVGMAEATLMLILMLVYDVRDNIRRVEGGLWRRSEVAGQLMEGLTIGIVGFGRIARHLSKLLAPFGSRILAYSPRVPENEMPTNVTKADLPPLLGESDIIVILAGLTPNTRHLIDVRAIDAMKPGALLVNTGRGEVIDEAALVQALRDRRIAAAALDVFTVEPLPSDSPLRGLDNVILTPHAVGHVRETRAAIVATIVENVLRILAGRLPLYCANPSAETAWRERIARIEALDT